MSNVLCLQRLIGWLKSVHDGERRGKSMGQTNREVQRQTGTLQKIGGMKDTVHLEAIALIDSVHCNSSQADCFAKHANLNCSPAGPNRTLTRQHVRSHAEARTRQDLVSMGTARRHDTSPTLLQIVSRS